MTSRIRQPRSLYLSTLTYFPAQLHHAIPDRSHPLHLHPLQNRPHALSALGATHLAGGPLDLLDEAERLVAQLLDAAARVLEAALALHVRDGVLLDLGVGRLLLEDVDEHQVGRVGADGVDDRERELALGEVLGEALLRREALGFEVEVVVEDLEEEADGVDEGDAVAAGVGGLVGGREQGRGGWWRTGRGLTLLASA